MTNKVKMSDYIRGSDKLSIHILSTYTSLLFILEFE